MVGKFYAGVGSRETPYEFKNLMTKTARLLDSLGYTLRSGAAKGADTWFEEGSALERKEIYIPWDGFNGRHAVEPGVHCGVTYEATELAKAYHPAWDRLKSGGQVLITRDVYQILGLDLNTPSRFVVCWTPGGKEKGGTAQAIRIAKSFGIPIFNFGIDSQARYAWRCVDEGIPLLMERVAV